MILLALIVFLCLLLILIPTGIEMYRKKGELPPDTLNTDPLMKEYVFHTLLAKEEIDQILSDRGEYEGVSYRYDKHTSEITLTYFGASCRYRMTVEDLSERDIHLLRVTMLDTFVHGYIPYIVNVFFIKALDAVPVAYQG